MRDQERLQRQQQAGQQPDGRAPEPPGERRRHDDQQRVDRHQQPPGLHQRLEVAGHPRRHPTVRPEEVAGERAQRVRPEAQRHEQLDRRLGVADLVRPPPVAAAPAPSRRWRSGSASDPRRPWRAGPGRASAARTPPGTAHRQPPRTGRRPSGDLPPSGLGRRLLVRGCLLWSPGPEPPGGASPTRSCRARRIHPASGPGLDPHRERQRADPT